MVFGMLLLGEKGEGGGNLLGGGEGLGGEGEKGF